MNSMKILVIPVFLALLSLSLAPMSYAFRGAGDMGGFGGDRGGMGDFHQNDFHDNNLNNINRNNNDFVGAYHGNNYWGAATVAVPVGGYYSSQCQTVQTCDSSGQCVLQNSCD